MAAKRDAEAPQRPDAKKQKKVSSADLFLSDKDKSQDESADNDNIDSVLLNHRDGEFDGHDFTTSDHAEGTDKNRASPGASSQQRSAQEVLHNPFDKPIAGTEEWHRIRKDNHKEVERRRRDNINAGIKELALLLPASETNKSQILQRAIEYIKRLKENEQNNIEKWTLEKLLNGQALDEVSSSNEKLKAELERAYREVEHWKKVCAIAKDSN